MQDARASRGVQLRGSRRDDRVVLGVDGHEGSRLRGRAQQRPVVVAALDVSGADHEHLEPGVALAHERRKLGHRRLARIGRHDVEREVGERPRRIP